MRWITNLVFRLKATLSPNRMEAELDEEMTFHLEMEMKKLIREGMSPTQARREAFRNFGDPFRQKEKARDAWGIRWIQDLRSDAGLTLRNLRRNPGFTLVAILTLALGIGGTTAIFSVLNGVVIKPLPYRKAQDLVALTHTMPGIEKPETPLGPALYRTFKDHARSLEAVGLWRSSTRTVTGLAEPERVTAIEVTETLFPLLGMAPFLGRGYTAEDVGPASTNPVILAHGYWQSRFGGDLGILNQTLRVQGNELPIIGVLPPGAKIRDQEADFFLPLRLDQGYQGVGAWSYPSIARLAPGFTPSQASEELSSLTSLACELYPGISLEELERRRFGTVATPLKTAMVGPAGKVLWVVFGAVAVVLLLACANVANLFLLKADGRARDVALRRTLGASRGRLVRQTLTESTLLGVAGGSAGLFLAVGGIQLLRRMAPPSLPRLEEIGVDPTTLLFTLTVTLSVSLLFGVLPEFRGDGASLTEPLKDGTPGAGVSRRRARVRSLFAVVQIALALVLLVGSGLMIRTFSALNDVPLGYERPEEVLTFRLSIPRAEAATTDEAVMMHQEILRGLSEIPSVISVSAASSLAMDGWESWEDISMEDFPIAEGDPSPLRRLNWITPDYFRTLESPILAGRAFDWGDVHEHRNVAIVTETLAREFWPTPQDALGKRFRMGDDEPWKEIIGLAGDIYTQGVMEAPPALVYFPAVMEGIWGFEVFGQRDLRYAIRTNRNRPTDLLPEARQAVWAVTPAVPLFGTQTLQDIFASSVSRNSFTLVMLGIAGGIAVLLGMVGVYGVVSFVVAQRRAEMAVRLAMGATSGQVGAMVIKEGAVLAGMGILVGVTLAIGLTRLLAGLLFSVHPLDPLTFGAVTTVVLIVVLMASYFPARQAASVDPMGIMRGG